MKHIPACHRHEHMLLNDQMEDNAESKRTAETRPAKAASLGYFQSKVQNNRLLLTILFLFAFIMKFVQYHQFLVCMQQLSIRYMLVTFSHASYKSIVALHFLQKNKYPEQ